MHASSPRARVGLLAIAVALTAALVGAPTAGAASIDGGTSKVDFKTFISAKKLKFKGAGTNPTTKSGGTLAVGQGTVTLNAQPSGNVSLGTTSTLLTFTLGKKKFTLSSFTYKLTTAKGALNAVVNKKGKAVTLFDVASQGKVKPNATFTELAQTASNMQLTKSGASAINKALGLKGKGVLKAKQKVGTMTLDADRSLTVVSGSSKTVYDQNFVNELRKCNIELSAVAPATPIAKDASAPEGGVDLPIRAGNGGALTADGLVGQVNHDGGTRLDRPAPGQPGNSTGKAEYHSPLRDFVFGFGPPPFSLTAFVEASNNNLPIGTVTGDLTATLTDTGGTVNLNGGSLNLSEAASGTLSQNQPPLGADCPIPAGSKIGAVTMVANVE